MSLFINTNSNALRAQRAGEKVSKSLEVSFKRISSGLRITGAADDAAGLQISERMGARERGVKTAVKNANDYLSLYQTAEGGLSEITNIMQRVRELAVQASNMTNNQSDRDSLQKEVVQLKDEIDRISSTTNFNNIKVLDGTFLNRLAQIGSHAGTGELNSIGSAKAKDLGQNVQVKGAAGVLAGIIPPFDELTFTNNGLVFQVKQKDGTYQDVAIRETTAADDTISADVISSFDYTKDPNSSEARRSSAIAKAAAINSSSAFTGITAKVGPTRTDLDFSKLAGTLSANPLFGANSNELVLGNSKSITATTIGGNNILLINGYTVGNTVVSDADGSGALVDSINAITDKTGVIAEVNGKGELVLVAEDGRNISINYKQSDGSYNANLASAIGLKNGFDDPLIGENTFVYTGQLTLISKDEISIKGSGGTYNISEVLRGISSVLDPATGNTESVMSDSNKYFTFDLNSDHSVKNIDISTFDGAQEALRTLDFALNQVSDIRAGLGAKMNRLESTVSALSMESQNLSNAISRIRDADIAVEVAQLSQSQIIQQASVSILAQANANNAQVLDLLK